MNKREIFLPSAELGHELCSAFGTQWDHVHFWGLEPVGFQIAMVAEPSAGPSSCLLKLPGLCRNHTHMNQF